MSYEYVVNTTQTAAARKDRVVGLFITQPGPGKFTLNLRTDSLNDLPPNLTFEEDTTLQGIQAKAATLLQQLSA